MYDAYWGISPIIGVTDFTPLVTIQIASNEAGPWIDSFDPLEGVNYAIGVSDARMSNLPTTWARLAVYNGGTFVQASRPVRPNSEFRDDRERNLYRELVRREDLALRLKGGYPLLLVKRILSGTTCPDCGSEVLEASASSPHTTKCGKCFGTGIYGGYYPPYHALGNWADPPRATGSEERSPQGMKVSFTTTVRVLPNPEMRAEDIVIDLGTGNRYLVGSNVKTVNYKIFVVAQILEVSLLPRQHPVYDLPIDPTCYTGVN